MKFSQFLFVCLLNSFITSFNAYGGFDSGNAGDAFSAEFINSGRDLLQRLEILSSSGAHLSVSLASLRKAIENTKVVSEERVYLDGIERDAVNFPEQSLLKINRQRWIGLRKSTETKARLTVVLHEFLWLSKVDDTNFSVSIPLIEKLNIPAYDPSVWKNAKGTLFPRIQCAARVDQFTYVEIHLTTKGAIHSFEDGEVKIFRKNNVFGYRFKKSDVAQFFESDDLEEMSAAVGLKAYLDDEKEVSIKYNGTNYGDQDLLAVIDEKMKEGSFGIEKGNQLLFWKGPGYSADDVYSLRNFVCAVNSDN